MSRGLVFHWKCYQKLPNNQFCQPHGNKQKTNA